MNSAKSNPDSTPYQSTLPELRDQNAEPMNSGSDLTITLLPHLAGAVLIIATVAATPVAMWNAAREIVTLTVGPTLFAISLTAVVCGLISFAVIWWNCERSSRSQAERFSLESPDSVAREQETQRSDAA